MSQEDLAEKSGVSLDSIRSYESGRNTPLFSSAYQLARALNCTPNDLCGWGDAE